MSETSRPKRKSGRPAIAGQAAPTPPPPEPEPGDAETTSPRRLILSERSRRSVARQKVDAMPARIATLEAELARVNEARGADADEVAQMLVRIAEAERTNASHQERAAELEAKVRELEISVQRLAEVDDACEAMRRDLEIAHGRARRDAEALELARERTRQDAEAIREWQERGRRDAEATDLAAHRAQLAEHAATEGARALQAAHEERDADRTRLTELEAKLARTRREHAQEASSLRTAHEEAELKAAHALEEERSAGARARQQAAAAETELASMRDRVQRASELLDAIERREEMAIAMRARAVDHVRRTLADGSARASANEEPSILDAAPKRAPSPAPRALCGDEPRVEVMSLDELEIDLPE